MSTKLFSPIQVGVILDVYQFAYLYTSVVKRPGTSVPSQYKNKKKTSRYQVFLSTGGTENPVNPVFDAYSPMISADRISESSFKNGIYSLARNVTELVKVWMNSSKVGHYT